MKILLIEPAKAPWTIGGEDVFLYEPLALEYLAAGVSPDHDVRILNYDYFDFIHTLLPTALPLRDFYEEYYQLLQKAIPVGKRLELLRKIRARDLPGLLRRTYRVYGQLRRAYRDYEGMQ
jgi:hypothetical protein